MNADVEHERELREQWERLHMEAHHSEQKALLIARAEIDRRLEAMNQLRKQVTSERGHFLLRESFDEQHAALRDVVDSRLKVLETTKSNLEGRLWMMGAAISGVVVVVNLIVYYFAHGK